MNCLECGVRKDSRRTSVEGTGSSDARPLAENAVHMSVSCLSQDSTVGHLLDPFPKTSPHTRGNAAGGLAQYGRSAGRGMLRREGAVRYVVLALLSAVSLKAAATEGVFLPGNGPIQRSRAGGGAASPRDASWMQLNPATITRLERRIDVGLDVLLSDVTLAPGGVIGNHSAGDLTDAQYFFIPSVGIIWPTDDAVFGVGLYAPSGIGVDYAASRDAISHFLQHNADRRLDYRHIRLIAACGHELRGGWSIGFNVNVSLSRFRTDSLTLRLVPTEGSNVWDDALGAGFSLGIYKVWDRLAFGASYQSRQWSQSFDRYADLLCSCLDLPQCVQLGVA